METSTWSKLPPLNYKIGRTFLPGFLLPPSPPDGHKLILVEGIPTMFSWENIEMFDGQNCTVLLK